MFFVNFEGKPLIIDSHFGTREWFTPTPLYVPLSSGSFNQRTLKCHATGWPLPTLKWFQNGQEIIKNAQYQLQKSYHGLMLQIVWFSKEQEGTYSCKASNSHGSNSYNVDVEVYCKSSSHFTVVDLWEVHWVHAQPRCLQRTLFKKILQPIIIKSWLPVPCPSDMCIPFPKS